MMAGVSIILPTYEEAATAPDTIAAVREAVGRPHDLLVVDDSPSSATADAVRSRFGSTDSVRVWRRQGDGLAAAILAGLERAARRYAVVMDADGQHDPWAVPELLARWMLAPNATAARCDHRERKRCIGNIQQLRARHTRGRATRPTPWGGSHGLEEQLERGEPTNA